MSVHPASPCAASAVSAAFKPGVVWHDSAGHPINAHGGGVLFHQGVYHWYGCHKIEGLSEATEAPAVTKRDGRYWMLAWGSTGWAPNPARAFSAASIFGPWTAHENPCEGVNPHNGLGPELAFGGQSASIITVAGRADAYIVFFDINKPGHPFESLYIWLPISFADGRMSIPWRDTWSLDFFTAEVRP